MRVYADTSFLVKLFAAEAGSETAMAKFRRLGAPRVWLLPLHVLECENAIRQRAFHARHSGGKQARMSAVRERDAALARFQRWRSRDWFTEVSLDEDSVFRRASGLSELHTEKLGCRAFDLLHVAYALELEAEVFLTSDSVQAKLATVAGLEAPSPH